jgi:small subunit ribosomal protein S7
MKSGKKSTASKIFYEALDIIAEKTEQHPYEVFKKALNKVTPVVELKARRFRGSVQQVPVETRPRRKESLPNKWIVESARKRSEKTMAQRLANEIIAAVKEEGGAIKKKMDLYRMAEANKAFSHLKF